MSNSSRLYPPPPPQKATYPRGSLAHALWADAPATQVADAKTFGPDPNRPASYVIVDKASGKAVMETFDHDLIPRLNTQKYDAVPIQIWLGSLNRGG